MNNYKKEQMEVSNYQRKYELWIGYTKQYPEKYKACGFLSALGINILGDEILKNEL